RNALPARHLEPLLQALVREGVLKGVRGPRGGYQLARERRRITVDEILKAAGTIEPPDAEAMPRSTLLRQVVMPPIPHAAKNYVAMLSRITIEELARRAEPFKQATSES